MISRQDIQRLLHRSNGESPVLSVFLDMSVNEVNQRTHRLFLDKELARHGELDSDREGSTGRRWVPLERIHRWLDDGYDPRTVEWPSTRRSAATGPRRSSSRCPSNRITISPARSSARSPRSWAAPSPRLLAVDREHLRLILVYLGEPLVEHEVQTEPYPAPHDTRAGGEEAKDRQKRKAEEVRHFFKEFAQEAAEFDRRYRPDDLILLGTRENVTYFIEFLPRHLRDKVAHTNHAPIHEPTPAILERLLRLRARPAKRKLWICSAPGTPPGTWPSPASGTLSSSSRKGRSIRWCSRGTSSGRAPIAAVADSTWTGRTARVPTAAGGSSAASTLWRR